MGQSYALRQFLMHLVQAGLMRYFPEKYSCCIYCDPYFPFLQAFLDIFSTQQVNAIIISDPF